jgi:hypothetical protein
MTCVSDQEIKRCKLIIPNPNSLDAATVSSRSFSFALKFRKTLRTSALCCHSWAWRKCKDGTVFKHHIMKTRHRINVEQDAEISHVNLLLHLLSIVIKQYNRLKACKVTCNTILYCTTLSYGFQVRKMCLQSQIKIQVENAVSILGQTQTLIQA